MKFIGIIAFLQSLCSGDNTSIYDRALYIYLGNKVSEELTAVGIRDEIIQLPYASLD